MQFLVRRIFESVPALFGVTLLTFLVLHLTPGDPAKIMLGPEARPADVVALRQALGLDDPLPLQYLRYLGRVVRGDLGTSMVSRQPVAGLIAERLPTTLTLAGASLFLALVLAVPLGVMAAVYRGKIIDYLNMALALIGVSAPTFWIALMLIYFFSYRLRILPATGWSDPFVDGIPSFISHSLMPIVTLALGMMALIPPALEQRPWKTADGPDACRRLVREYARMGTHWIKICTSGGVLSGGDESGWRNYTDAEIAAIVDEAHSLGKRVAAHAHSRSGISQALQGGVDSIEHGTELDESLAELMIRTGAFLVPTPTIGQFLEDEGAANGIPEESMRKAHASYARQIRSIRLAHAAGVPIVAGTDSCMSMPFGRHARELQYLVEQIGLSPSEAIVCATGRAAEAMGIGRETGTVQSGKWADVLVVNGDPVSNIGILQDSGAILGVFREGKLLVDRGMSSRFENPERD